jgi:hypothetical protein
VKNNIERERIEFYHCLVLQQAKQHTRQRRPPKDTWKAWDKGKTGEEEKSEKKKSTNQKRKKKAKPPHTTTFSLFRV